MVRTTNLQKLITVSKTRQKHSKSKFIVSGTPY